jgi:DNA-binding MarR family transcriptional regulator
MNPIDYRTTTWEAIAARITGDRATVLAALRHHGPCTTRQLATAMGWDILNVRPRVTELCQLGFADIFNEIRDPAPGREGTYLAISDQDAMEAFRHRKFSTTAQLHLL